MVCYKAYEDIPYKPGAITREKALSIAGAMIPLIGAYFNPVHSNPEKVVSCSGALRYRRITAAMTAPMNILFPSPLWKMTPRAWRLS